jgi:hypothetical protein
MESDAKRCREVKLGEKDIDRTTLSFPLGPSHGKREMQEKLSRPHKDLEINRSI